MTLTDKSNEGKKHPEVKRGTEEKKEKKVRIGKDSKKERLRLRTNMELEQISEKTGGNAPQEEEESAAEPFFDKIKNFFAHKLEWLKEKFKGSRNNFTSILLVVLDHALEYVRPDENGGTQDRDDLLELSDKLVEGPETPEEKLAKIGRDRFMLHKNNHINEFKEACESGINFEFDIRWNGKEIVVRHNNKANNPEVTLNQYIEMMKQYPSWKGQMQIDVKDRLTVPNLKEYLAQMPKNFRDGIMIGTFDPAVVLQVHENFNKNAAPGERIPISLHCLPLMRYENANNARRAAITFNENRKLIQQLTKSMADDSANDPLAAVETSRVYTSYEEYMKSNEPDAEHIVLALENPITEIMQKDARIIEAVIFSGGEISIPYDPKYLQWIKDNAEKTGIDFRHIGVGTWKTSHDDLYDALMWQDNSGNRITRISVDREKI